MQHANYHYPVYSRMVDGEMLHDNLHRQHHFYLLNNRCRDKVYRFQNLLLKLYCHEKVLNSIASIPEDVIRSELDLHPLNTKVIKVRGCLL